MKLIIFKKSFIIAAALILAAGIAFGIVCGSGIYATSSAGEKVIVIDAGHVRPCATVWDRNSGVRI